MDGREVVAIQSNPAWVSRQMQRKQPYSFSSPTDEPPTYICMSINGSRCDEAHDVNIRARSSHTFQAHDHDQQGATEDPQFHTATLRLRLPSHHITINHTGRNQTQKTKRREGYSIQDIRGQKSQGDRHSHPQKRAPSGKAERRCKLPRACPCRPRRESMLPSSNCRTCLLLTSTCVFSLSPRTD